MWLAEVIPPEVLGPYGVVVVLMVVLALFYTGKILPRNAVPREDFDKLLDINASYAEALKVLTKSSDELVNAIRYQQKNGVK